MAKTTAPLLSFDAGGQIGKAQVYARWKGRAYARRYTVPANPNSADQQQTRGTMKYLTQVFKLFSSDASAPWYAFAKGKTLTQVNAFIKSNLSTLRGANGSPPSNLNGFIGSPGVGGGLAPVSAVLTDGGTHHITVTMTAPTLPSGWTISEAVAVALKDEGAPTGTDYNSYSATDSSNPYAPSIAAPAAGTYRVASWFVFTKPDGTLAYGPSLNGSVVIA